MPFSKSFCFLAYIGPGTDLFFQSFAGILSFLIALITLFGLFLRQLYHEFKKRKKWVLSAAALLALGFLVFHFFRSKEGTMRVIVLGVDGLDPAVVESMMRDNKLPGMKKLAAAGCFSRLATAVPPQSPVVWASFVTGSNPGNHGVFDFLSRDPDTYLPVSALTDIEQPKTLTLGKFVVPLGASRMRSPVRGLTVWEVASKNKIPTTVLRCPLTFPPSKVYGRMLSGLGTPDLCGTQGLFTFYTSRSDTGTAKTGGRIVHVRFVNGEADTHLVGPRNTMDREKSDATIPLKITVDREGGAAVCSVQGKQYRLSAGQWSEWIHLRFAMGGFSSVDGICRLYLKRVAPDFELYVSPINFDPEKPAFPVSYPRSYAKQLAGEIGAYHTLGQAGDTWALNEGILSPAEALQQYRQVMEEDKKLLFHELARFDHGLFFCYFGITDTIQHMFPRDPAGTNNEVEDIYREIDRILEEVLAKYADRDTAVIVLSDHGFAPLKRFVHLNTWLKENNYLYLREGSTASGEFFDEVDWSRTRAYAIGLSGIYLNMKGREKEGIVSPGDEAKRLTAEIAEKLKRLTDPGSRDACIRNVYMSEDVYHGPYAERAPDMIVGFNPGWRVSWQTALGGVPPQMFEDNKRAWRQDHIFDPSSVPGVLLMNRRMKTNDLPRIIDVAPTILRLLNTETPKEFEGVSLL